MPGKDQRSISMSGTSQVLRELRNLGAVECRADGKLAYYRLADRSWLEVAESVLQRFAPARDAGVPVP